MTTVESFEPGSHIHLVGIAGSGMNGIAQILKKRGFVVSGSDAKDSPTLHALQALGITTFVGHRADQISSARYLVISSAITDANPELAEARSRGVEVVRRANALARLLPGKFSIAVAGTHGKTTTSGMLSHLLDALGRDPSFVIGSPITSLGVSAREGSGGEFVVEADESDGSFLEYRPDAAIITNVELDHVDNFSSLDEVMRLFTRFIESVRSFVVVCADDENAASLKVPDHLTRITYGFSAGSDLRLLETQGQLPGDEPEFELHWKGASIGALRLRVPGRHNLLNAAAVIATVLHRGDLPSRTLEGISSFTGTARRFEIKGEVNGIVVVDDYGHHPTEIEATLASARSFLRQRDGGRIAVIFQPHRFSRTVAFLDGFAASLSKADHAILLEIYSAGERAIDGVSSAEIASKMRSASYCRKPGDAIEEVVAWARSGDLILTLGAGDVTDLGPEIIDALSAREATGKEQ